VKVVVDPNSLAFVTHQWRGKSNVHTVDLSAWVVTWCAHEMAKASPMKIWKESTERALAKSQTIPTPIPLQIALNPAYPASSRIQMDRVPTPRAPLNCRMVLQIPITKETPWETFVKVVVDLNSLAFVTH
jgi:hypothetical protein